MKETSKNRFDEIKVMALKNARTWMLKELMRELWSYRSMIETAKLISRHLPNDLTYFKHRITHAVAEGTRSRIAIYSLCGSLNLYPAPITHKKAV